MTLSKKLQIKYRQPNAKKKAALRRGTAMSDGVCGMQKPNRARMPVDSPQDGIYHLFHL
jgi:hypothetical protein